MPISRGTPKGLGSVRAALSCTKVVQLKIVFLGHITTGRWLYGTDDARIDFWAQGSSMSQLSTKQSVVYASPWSIYRCPSCSCRPRPSTGTGWRLTERGPRAHHAVDRQGHPSPAVDPGPACTRRWTRRPKVVSVLMPDSDSLFMIYPLKTWVFIVIAQLNEMNRMYWGAGLSDRYDTSLTRSFRSSRSFPIPWRPTSALHSELQYLLNTNLIVDHIS